MAWRNKEEEKLERREENQGREQQGTREPGEKKKKSWREIDAQRDGSRGQRGQSEGPKPAKGESFAYRAYKSKLDKLFDGRAKLSSGPEIEVVRKSEAGQRDDAKHPPSPASDAHARQDLPPKERLKQADDADEITAAARACLDAGGLPSDPELLAKVLALNDAALVYRALEALLDACERGRPKNARALAARLTALEASLEDPAARDIARGLLSRFR